MIFKISQNGVKFKFPVNPPEFTVTGGGRSFTDTFVMQGGEHTIIGLKQLEGISFSSFFPKHYDPSYCNYKNIPKPWSAVKKINKLRNTKKPVKLLISGTNITMYATIRKFEYKEKGGEPGDIYYDIEFKQYQFIKIREIVRKNSKKKNTTKTDIKPETKIETKTETKIAKVLLKNQQQTGRPDTKENTKTYIVQKNDCLWTIAKKFYGTGAEYTKIYEANKNTIKNANIIYEGQVLKIP